MSELRLNSTSSGVRIHK
ncbi:hypothetical protein F383_39214 [Gossypium arboreum]|uniref:Uncharacterized protein n=1 Tax=Gossypium arboreum TaxID=29729 RepID=A0A0B0MLR3_GOSAR|nr:hypothetical protein F383_39214 [Gossypium arboreum]